MQNLLQFAIPLLDLSSRAGRLIRSHYQSAGPGDFQAKADQSPLTLADTASHLLLRAGLRALDSSLPILSEESPPRELVGRRNWQRYWLVDPLDGTREFLAGTGEFTINIALIDDHRPVLGLLYLPLEELGYLGIPGQAAQRYHQLAGRWVATDLRVRALAPGAELAVLASRRHSSATLDGCMEWLRDRWGPVARLNSGSALKFCQLARGDGDFYPRFSPCCEWDTAAGQAVLEAAGGSLLGLDGQPLRYNCRDTLYSPHFLAIADPRHFLWNELFAARLF